MLNRIKSKLKRSWNDIIFSTPLITRNLNYSGRNTIVMYHGIDTAGNNPFNSRHTPIRFFDKQIKFLKTHYKVVALSDFFTLSATEKNLCAITFDDGYLNNVTNALPVLEKHNTPATFFITGINETGYDILWADYVNIVNKICTKEVTIDGEVFVNYGNGYVSRERKLSLIDVVKNEKCDYSFKERIYAAFNPIANFRQTESYKEYWQLISDEGLKKFSQSKLVTIGSHGYYHNNLGNIADEAAFDELRRSKKYLENLTQQPVTSIGYPDGSYSDAVSNYAASIGIIHQTCSESFNKEADRSYSVLKNRAGIYNVDSAANQLLNALNYPL